MYSAIVKMISTEYTRDGQTLTCEFKSKIWYCLDETVIAYSTDIEIVTVKAKTVAALNELIFAEVSRMENDINTMDQEFRSLCVGYERIK